MRFLLRWRPGFSTYNRKHGLMVAAPTVGGAGRGLHRPARRCRPVRACRCCSGSAPGNRTPAAGRCPAGSCCPTRTWTPRPPGSWREKVDLTRVAHLEQIGVFSDPRADAGRAGDGDRIPRAWCRSTPTRGCRPTPAWHPVDDLPEMALDHRASPTARTGGCRPSCPTPTSGSRWRRPRSPWASYAGIYATTLGHDVDPTNLQRILTRRGMLEPTGSTAPPGPAGGRPAAMFRFTVRGSTG